MAPPRDVAMVSVSIDLGAGRRGVDMGPSALRIAGITGAVESLGFTVDGLITKVLCTDDHELEISVETFTGPIEGADQSLQVFSWLESSNTQEKGRIELVAVADLIELRRLVSV